MFSVFPTTNPGLNFDGFKKTFFPQHYLVTEEPDDFQEQQALALKVTITRNKD